MNLICVQHIRDYFSILDENSFNTESSKENPNNLFIDQASKHKTSRTKTSIHEKNIDRTTVNKLPTVICAFILNFEKKDSKRFS